MAHDILIVDDEDDIRDLIAGVLEDDGYKTRGAKTDVEVMAAVAARKPSLVILDIWLQGSKRDGLALLELIKADHPDVPIIMISGHGTIETAVAAIHKGAYDFIEKPFKADRLLLQVARAVEAARLRQQVAELQVRAGHALELIGDSAAITAVRQAIERIAPTNSRVLISGPPGSGKEVVARLVHAHSRRADAPFVVLNAAAMAPERMEIELFGNEASQSGDTRRRAGVLEQAHGGTLFIDEVAEMPVETQSKILRVLVDQSFERVGGSSKVQVDVRIVSASSRDLALEMAAGRFRQDLFHRLNVVPIRIPSLKERREDIPLLVRFFMRKEAEAHGLPPREIGEDALAVLQTADWPGNVRELRNIVARLLIMAPGDARTVIGAAMLPADLSGAARVGFRGDRKEEMMSLPLREARELFEREYLLAQVTRFGGNISRTASFVGMERSALHRKLKSLGVSSNDKGAALQH